MKRSFDIEVAARWDVAVVPANESSRRGLLVDIHSPAVRETARGPVNLSLVIDRSGSMRGERLSVAKRAARGVAERLGERDVLSVVAFDDQITTLVDGIRLDRHGKREALRAIARLRSGGTTNLAGGWLKGAERAARVMDRKDLAAGHVVVLSDGHANVGIQDPGKLRVHADNMASRGVTTSAVGVGNSYSPLQLEALCDGGLGRLHDAATPDEMMETVLGELGDVRAVIARDVELHLQWPRAVAAELLADYEAVGDSGRLTVRLGQLVGGCSRSLPFLIDVEALSEGRSIPIELSVTGRDPESGFRLKPAYTNTVLRVVPPREVGSASRDNAVAERISMMWGSTVSLNAMRMNESGDYAGASALVADARPAVMDFCFDLDVEDELDRELGAMEERVSADWDGRSKRAHMSSARKRSKSERDHRSSRHD